MPPTLLPKPGTQLLACQDPRPSPRRPDPLRPPELAAPSSNRRGNRDQGPQDLDRADGHALAPPGKPLPVRLSRWAPARPGHPGLRPSPARSPHRSTLDAPGSDRPLPPRCPHSVKVTTLTWWLGPGPQPPLQHLPSHLEVRGGPASPSCHFHLCLSRPATALLPWSPTEAPSWPVPLHGSQQEPPEGRSGAASPSTSVQGPHWQVTPPEPRVRLTAPEQPLLQFPVEGQDSTM